MLKQASNLESLIAVFDWSRTSLGAKADWPAHVRNTVALILNAKLPMVTLWGREGVMIYNDAYADFASKKAPRFAWRAGA